MRRESQGIELGETFDVGRELREDTKHHIEDDRRFLESGDYWEHFEDERKWVLHHLSPRFKLCGPTEEQKAGDGPGERNLDPMRFTRLEYRNGEVEEIWDNRFSGRSRASRKWVGFSAFWEEGYAPGAPEERTKRASGTTRTRRLVGLDYEQDMPRLERPYASSGKPNSILSEDWRDLSCKQREAYLVPPPAPFRFSADKVWAAKRKPKSKAMPRSVLRGSGSQDAAAGVSDVGATDTTESYEVVASDDDFETDEGQIFTDTDGGYEMVNALGTDVNPDSPPETPRANWTAEDFARLQQVMRTSKCLPSRPRLP